MTQSDVPPISGLLENKYELVGMIGRGGMGSVWEARHHSLGTRFAVKFIEAEYADSEEARKRFRNEAQAAATIQSKHAIQIYDHGITHDGKPFIVMELLAGGQYGGPLDKVLERGGGRITLQQTATILGQVSRGLARAHERGIVHRDLKPENIFLVESPEDGELVAKVLDFGIAKIQSANSPGLTSSTKTGAVLGTPFYMSPEQARGLRNVDHRTDVWSLGVIAFRCVTGKLPFDGESVGDLLVKICTAPTPIPSREVPGLPSSFDAWFARALEREPERRFQTVNDLAEALSYAAGVTPRGAGPFSGQIGSGQQATVAASSHQPQIVVTPPPGQMAAYGTPRPQMQDTPAPGAMTAAPFTSSTPVPGVPTPGRAKYIVGAMLAGLLVAGGGTGGYVYMQKHRAGAQADAVGITPPPPASISAPPPPSSVADNTKPPDPPASGSAAAKDTPPVKGGAGTNAAGGKVATGTTGGKATPGKTGPFAAGGHETTTPPVPTPTQTHEQPKTKPTPTATNAKDPGY